eukprot:798976-Amphidinium_carterae.1
MAVPICGLQPDSSASTLQQCENLTLQGGGLNSPRSGQCEDRYGHGGQWCVLQVASKAYSQRMATGEERRPIDLLESSLWSHLHDAVAWTLSCCANAIPSLEAPPPGPIVQWVVYQCPTVPGALS